MSSTKTLPYKLRSSQPAMMEGKPGQTAISPDEDKDLKSLIISLKTDLTKDIAIVKQQSDTILNDLKSALNDIKVLSKENDDLKIENQRLKNNLCIVNSELKQQADKLTQLELYTRRENLVFYGIRQDQEENCEKKVKGVLNNIMKLGDVDSIKFDRCHRLPGPKPQPIITRFNWYQDRERVWSAKSNLKATAISISEDFPAVVAENRRSLYPIMMQARKLNHFAVLQADKLKIDNNIYSTENLHTLPSELNPAKLATVEHGEVTAFYGSHSPLSNFYQCDIVIDGKKYMSVEHYFQSQKCYFAEDQNAIKRMSGAKSSLQCKQIGDSVIVNSDEWLAEAKREMYKGMKAKFHQNEYARNFLQATGKNHLAEATANKVWGTGLKLNDPNNSMRNKWTGQNVTGEILTKLRDELFNM